MNDDLKLNKKKIPGIIFYIIVGLLCAYGLYYIILGTFIPKNNFVSDIMLGMLCGIVMLIAFFLAYHSIMTDALYYKIVDISIVRFEINLYENMLVLAIDNHAWSYTYDFKKIAEYKQIKCLYQYDRKKKLLRFEPIPYQK